MVDLGGEVGGGEVLGLRGETCGVVVPLPLTGRCVQV
jgi:hypothetical protein